MKPLWKRAIASSLVLALIAALCLGCAGPSEEKVIIRIGQITDLTGISSPSLLPLNYAVEDVAKYYNEEGLIPGVEIKIVTYNEQSDYSREVPGYYWVRERGAQIIVTLLPTTGETLKSFSEKDEVPLAALGGSMALVEPPGWQFWFNAPPSHEIRTLLKWISENDWDWETKGPAKIGFAAWEAPYQIELKTTLEEYCQDHSEQFQLVGSYLVPIGTPTWTGEVEKLKDCDYIVRGAIAQATGAFVRDFQARGYTTTYIGGSAMTSFRGFIVDFCGWEALDGALTTSVCPWWNEESAIVDLAEALLDRYRPDEAEDMIHAGTGYLGGVHNMLEILEIVQAAVEEVGAENFDSQAFYDAAMNYRTAGPMWAGYPEWSFTETKRYLADHVMIYEWSAEAEDLVAVSGWLPFVTE
jgi:hypothetical protein